MRAIQFARQVGKSHGGEIRHRRGGWRIQSLTAAVYLAKTGKSVLVIEMNARCGGGAMSREIAPGFIHDPHATGLMTCMVSPTLTRDELGDRSSLATEEPQSTDATNSSDSTNTATHSAESVHRLENPDAIHGQPWQVRSRARL